MTIELKNQVYRRKTRFLGWKTWFFENYDNRIWKTKFISEKPSLSVKKQVSRPINQVFLSKTCFFDWKTRFIDKKSGFSALLCNILVRPFYDFNVPLLTSCKSKVCKCLCIKIKSVSDLVRKRNGLFTLKLFWKRPKNR